MNKIFFIFLLSVACLISSAALAEPGTSSGSARNAVVYNPLTTYTGDYQPDVVLFKNPGTIAWQSIPRLDRLRSISCQDALNHLNREGMWKGHLNPDGSCGSTAEPSDWALGNRLNFENDLAN